MTDLIQQLHRIAKAMRDHDLEDWEHVSRAAELLEFLVDECTLPTDDAAAAVARTRRNQSPSRRRGS